MLDPYNSIYLLLNTTWTDPAEFSDNVFQQTGCSVMLYQTILFNEKHKVAVFGVHENDVKMFNKNIDPTRVLHLKTLIQSGNLVSMSPTLLYYVECVPIIH